MINILSALIPVFSLIMIGYFFKKIKFPSYEFWPMADKLTYYVLMPSLLVYKLSSASLEGQNTFSLVLTALLTITVILFILILVNKISPNKADSFTSIMQGTIRFNTYVFLALASSLYEDTGLIFAAIILTFVIPFINIICISIFALYLNENKLTLKFLLKSIFTNPLILACIIGGLINFMKIPLPQMLENTLAILSAAALPLGLLSVGFALTLRDISKIKNQILLSSILKLMITPIIMYLFTLFFDMNQQSTIILMIFAVLPTAPSAFVFARQFGGDIKLMSAIITIQTLISSVFIIIVLNIFL